jgi:hypothetical protein
VFDGTFAGLQHLDNKEYLAMDKILELQRKAEQVFGTDWYNPTCYATKILDAKYGNVSTNEVVDQLTFPVRGSQAFSIVHIHTQNNTTF